MPSPIPRRNRLVLVIGRFRYPLCDQSAAAFPMMSLGRLPHQRFRGLNGVHCCYRLHARGTAKQPFPSRASAVWLPARLSRLLPGAMTTSRTGLSPVGIQHTFHGARHPPFSQNPSIRRSTSLIDINALKVEQALNGIRPTRTSAFPHAQRQPSGGSNSKPRKRLGRDEGNKKEKTR
jgi:hypothetical protein